MKKFLLSILAAAAVMGCANDSDTTPSLNDDNAVKFSSELTTRTATTDNETYTWVYDDAIGISSVGFGSEYTNVKYTADDDGEYTDFRLATGESEILFPTAAPTAKGSVIFYAYYPYGTPLTSGLRTIDISKQKSEGLCAVDFMTAASSSVEYYVGMDDDDRAVTFDFDHKLTQVIFNIKCNNNISSLSGLKASLLDIETQGDYIISGSDIGKCSGDLYSVADLELTVTSTGETTATITAILHPGDYTTSAFCLEFGDEKHSTPFAASLEPNKSYTFSTTLGSDITPFDDYEIGTWGNGDDYTFYPETFYNIKLVDDIYEIYTAAGLAEFRDMVNSGSVSINGKLMCDIDLMNVLWTPIGNASNDYYYKGAFDGNGYEVQNLYVNIDNDNYVAGLFGMVYGGTITKLGIGSGSVTISINGVVYAGGIAGRTYDGCTISYCYNKATITAYQKNSSASAYVGGIAGSLSNDDNTITNCYNRGTILASNAEGYTAFNTYAGGIIGNSINSGDKITNCYSASSVTATGGNNNYAGGVMGYSSATETYCYWDSNYISDGIDEGSFNDSNSSAISALTDTTLAATLNAQDTEDSWVVDGSYAIFKWELQQAADL